MVTSRFSVSFCSPYAGSERTENPDVTIGVSNQWIGCQISEPYTSDEIDQMKQSLTFTLTTRTGQASKHFKSMHVQADTKLHQICFLPTPKQGDNVLGSGRPSVCLSVYPSSPV